MSINLGSKKVLIELLDFMWNIDHYARLCYTHEREKNKIYQANYTFTLEKSFFLVTQSLLALIISNTQVLVVIIIWQEATSNYYYYFFLIYFYFLCLKNYFLVFLTFSYSFKIKNEKRVFSSWFNFCVSSFQTT